MSKHLSYFQGDIGFVPLALFGKTAADVSRNKRLRAHDARLLIQEGESTGHHHGVWANVAMFRDDGLARAVADTAPTIITAQLFEDASLAGRLGLDTGAPVIGFLIAETDVSIQHATADGKLTGEHDTLNLPSGGYVVLGKREWTAGDQRRVAD